MRRCRNLIFILCVTLFSLPLSANTPDMSDDESQSATRENPDIVETEGDRDNAPQYNFIKTDQNHIIYNGADWSRLFEAFYRLDGDNAVATNDNGDNISIVHIGDSHLQADMGTAVTRRLLQESFGNAGRGLVIPFRISGTNQPLDYQISSDASYSFTRMFKSTSAAPLGFTGVTIVPQQQEFGLTVSSISKTDDYSPFKRLKIYYGGSLSIDNIVIDGDTLQADVAYDNGCAVCMLPKSVTTVTLCISSSKSIPEIYGADLYSDDSGIVYHVIGNNGATYSCYLKINNFASAIAEFVPNLIIVSLGANEAYGAESQDDIYNNIDNLLSQLRNASPDATFLLTTPMESQKKYSRKVVKGKRRHRRTTTVTSYKVNGKVEDTRNTILRYAKKNNIAVYDWYSIAGGDGASDKWTRNSLMGADRIHCTSAGYTLQGEMMYDAIITDIYKYFDNK